jgi:type IV secretory pathway VirJ component
MKSPVTAVIVALLVAGAAAARPPAPGAKHPTTAAAGALPPNAERISHGRFHDLVVYRPAQPARSFVLFLSGESGWKAEAESLAQQLVQTGAMVAGIDLPRLAAEFNTDASGCVFPDGDLENLSHFVQAYFHNSTYLAPILVGMHGGASLAYASLAQAPRDTFAGALTVNFCPLLSLEKTMCRGSGLEYQPHTAGADAAAERTLRPTALRDPWVSLQSGAAGSCAANQGADFIAAVHGAAQVKLPNLRDSNVVAVAGAPLAAALVKLTAEDRSRRVAPAPTALGDLPVVEVPAAPGAPPSDAVAVLMSGDGGWAGLDQDVATALTAKGIPVVGLDSLRYYWTARTPDGLAADTDKLIRYYLARYQKRRVLLVGYSQGADVLPFAVNRLPEDSRAKVALVAVMGMSEHALFEFHVSSWISDDSSGPATLPEVNRISGVPVLCIYGADESDSLCPKLDPNKITVVKVKGGHHFDGDYAGLARTILAAAKP